MLIIPKTSTPKVVMTLIRNNIPTARYLLIYECDDYFRQLILLGERLNCMDLSTLFDTSEDSGSFITEAFDKLPAGNT